MGAIGDMIRVIDAIVFQALDLAIGRVETRRRNWRRRRIAAIQAVLE
jgi:hypothetical protein